MNGKIKFHSILMLMMLIFAANVFAQKDLIEVFDGRETFPSFEKPKSENQKLIDGLVKNQTANIRAILKKEPPADCKISPWVRTILEGAFTKPNSLQKAILYQVTCDEKLSISNDFGFGLMIVENDKVIINQIVSMDNVQSLKKLPDINQNGLAELVIVSTFNYGSVMDFNQVWLDIFEAKSTDSLAYLGTAVTHWWAGLAKDPKNNSANYKIFAKPSTKPTFFRETYREGKDDKWVLTKNLEEFALTIKEKKID